MNIQKQQALIADLYRRGDVEGAKNGFEDLLLHLEETDETELPAYGEALLGLGTLNQKDLRDLPAAEYCWQRLVSLLDDPMEACELDEDAFDVYTQGLLLLALVQKELKKTKEAEKNLKALRTIAVEIRGEKSPDVEAIDGHLASLR